MMKKAMGGGSLTQAEEEGVHCHAVHAEEDRRQNVRRDDDHLTTQTSIDRIADYYYHCQFNVHMEESGSTDRKRTCFRNLLFTFNIALIYS
jgi:hypothetical protein